jgi:DNA-binding XRE family transcriptional regulator
MDADIRTFSTNDGRMEINLSVPIAKGARIVDALYSMLALTGLRARRIDEDGDEIVSAEDVLGDVPPGTALRGLRVKEDITQRELAEQLNISQNMVSEMESGKRPITPKTAKRIAEKFNVPYKTFL